MTKSLALTCLLSTTITAALATQPVRRILVSDGDGKISSVALDSLGLSRPGGGEMRCTLPGSATVPHALSIRFPKTDLVAWDKRLWVRYRASESNGFR